MEPMALTAPVHAGTSLHLGAVFPQTEIGRDPADLRLWVTAVEAAGFDYVCAYDHVLGADPDRPGGWSGPYTHDTPFHEVLVLLGWMAGLTERIELATEVLVLPQRQAALVAKQAAEVAILSGGRLRLGVGLGWNAVEYQALGMSFADRARRIEEQIEVMRLLWAEPVVRFQGTWHEIDAAGLNHLPPGGSVPVWMGGQAEAAIRRAARIADGWMVNARPGPELDRQLALLGHALREGGRDARTFGIAGRVDWRGDAAEVAAQLRGWQRAGATHASVNTMRAGCTSATDHVAALQAAMAAWREAQLPG